MRIAVTGASGLIGSALVPLLRRDGHEVLRLVRRARRAPDELPWDPTNGAAPVLDGVDGVVHLAGAGLAERRWTPAYKQVIRASRVDGTATVSHAVAAARPRPAVLLSASAIGWYGDTGTEAVDERAPAGQGFLAETARAWEAASAPAANAGVRVVRLRTGLVVAAQGGAWGRLFPIFRLGLGGRLASGRQYWSFISLADQVAAIRFLLGASEVSGPVNLTAPEPVTNAEVTRAMGRVLHRPTLLPVPAVALRIALGEFAEDVLMSQRVLPRRLLAAGFVFRHPDIDSAVAAAWDERRSA